jgi:hypothetical protein
VQHPLSAVDHYCDVGIVNALLTLAASHRTPAESAELSAYMATPEFLEVAARLESRVPADVTRCARMSLDDLAAELALPIDLAAQWLDRVGIPLDIAIDVRAAA